MNFGDAVADFGHRADLGHGHPGVEILDLLSNDFAYLVCPDFLCHVCSERKVGRGWWAAGGGVFSTAHCPLPTAHLWIHQSPLHLRQLISDRAVVNQAADARDHATDDRGVGSKLQPHLLAGRGLQLALQRGLLPFADLARGRDLSRYDVHPRVEFARERLQHLIQIVQSRFAQQKLQEVGGRLTGADPSEQLVEHGAFAFGRDHRAGEHVAQLRMFVHHPLEADQFLYDLVRFATLDKHISQRARITICNCSYTHILVVGGWRSAVEGWRKIFLTANRQPPPTLFRATHLLAYTREQLGVIGGRHLTPDHLLGQVDCFRGGEFTKISHRDLFGRLDLPTGHFTNLFDVSPGFRVHPAAFGHRFPIGLRLYLLKLRVQMIESRVKLRH